MSAALTTPRAGDLRPAAILAAVAMTAVVVVALAGSRLTTLRVDPRPGDAPAAAGGAIHLGIPYQGTGVAAEIIRGSAGGSAPLVAMDATDTTGIPYQGTGLAADLIRGSFDRGAGSVGVPYQGAGAAADLIRGSFSDTMPAALPAATGIPYQGTGLAADLIRDSFRVAPTVGTRFLDGGR